MKCRSIEIKKLFQTFDYKFSWQENIEKVLLLTGPNGYGKTTLLKILYYLKEGQWYYFYKLPFEEIVIEFDNGTKFKITELHDAHIQSDSKTEDVSNPRRTLSFELIVKDEVQSKFLLQEEDIRNIEINNPQTRNKFIRYVEDKNTLQDALEYLSQNKNLYDFLSNKDGYDTIRMFVEALNVNYIPANRIFSIENGNNVLSVKSISNQIKEKLRRANYRYLNRVSEARSNIFENLLIGASDCAKEEYVEETLKLKEKVITMHKWGLIPFKDFIPYQEGYGKIFSVYLNEIKETLVLYEEIYNKLKKFSSLLGKKNFVNKTIEYSPSRGILVKSTQGKPIDIDCLSSGEQNEIILLYNFIFQISSNSILLIDEPENSLHVEWQSVFYEELEEICNMNNIQVIVATHSPQIIGERWEQCIDLFDQTEDIHG